MTQTVWLTFFESPCI